MRLWHKDLIPVLPQQQLLGQWRECCAIMANIAKKGTPNHTLVNRVMDYDKNHMFTYAMYIECVMATRGYRCNWLKFEKLYRRATKEKRVAIVYKDELFSEWMNERYLRQCYYNLQEKYDCGGITEDEWQKIDARYKELIGGNEWQ